MRIDTRKLPGSARPALCRLLLERPFNYEAVYSDESAEYVDNSPPERGEAVTVKLRLLKGQNAIVKLIADGRAVPMQKTETAGYFDYYTASLEVYNTVRYYFSVEFNGNVVYYDKAGLQEEAPAVGGFSIIPGFAVPDWAKGAVMYQIFVDRFRNGDASNDPVNNEYAYLGRGTKHMDWNDPVQNDDVCCFYGGDLAGIIEKLPYLKDLGVEALYLNPVFVSPSSHKYDIQDYDYIDPHFGAIVNDGGDPLFFERFRNKYASKYIKRCTLQENLDASNALFARLVDEAHKKGIRVILDGVFNHCGAFNKWMDREGFYEAGGYPPGAYASEDSPYVKYFRWTGGSWPDNEDYEGWWGYKNHPKLNFEGSPELFSYILEVARKWVSPPYNADGWRLDVAADLGYSPEFNHRFWAEFRRVVKTANPDAVIIAEHYGDPSSWLAGDQWDSIMNYDAFMEPVTWFLCGVEKHSDEFRPDVLNNPWAFISAMRRHTARLPQVSLLTAMNQLSNHDHSRFLTRTNRKVGRLHTSGHKAASAGTDKSVMRLAVLIQMTWPGSPCVYYGDEAGLAGWTDPDDRRPYPWGNEDREMIDFHKCLIAIRSKSPGLRRGSLEYLAAETGLIAYCRYLGVDKYITVINNSDREKAVLLPVWRLNVRDGAFTRIVETSKSGFNTEPARIQAAGGYMSAEVAAGSGILLRAEES